jgi:hypothetical protein
MDHFDMMNDIRKPRIWLLAGCITLSALSAASGQSQTAPDIIPFKAVYNVNYAPTNDQSVIISGKGSVTIEIAGSRCTEYRGARTVTFTMNTRNGVDKYQSVATEVGDPAGTQIAFSYSERLNGKQVKQFSLTGRRGDDGRITITSRSLPGGKAELPKGTLLGLQYEQMVQAAITEGRKSVVANVYNPEISMTAVEHTTTSIGPEVRTALPAGHVANIEALKNAPRHRVEMIARDANTGKVRVREQMTRFPNGVLTVSDTVMEYMKIKAAIGSLTMPPQKACS